jgi:DNA-binding XRE family transcriptional regulator
MRKNGFRLETVTTVLPHKLEITYTDKSQITVDLTHLIQSLKVFEPLETAEEFTSATITDFGFTMEWACGASLDSDRLFEMALEQSGMIANAHFRRWQDVNDLSLTQAAQAIGLTRRTISQYRTGKRPVPRTVSLACKGWEVEQVKNASPQSNSNDYSLHS